MSNEPDSELEKALTQTLDASLARIDAQTSVQLAAARRAALYQRKAWQRGAFGIAAAAAVAALAILPWHNDGKTEDPNALSANDADYLPADPQLLNDMDMLSDMEMIDALGEVAGSSTTQDVHATDG